MVGWLATKALSLGSCSATMTSDFGNPLGRRSRLAEFLTQAIVKYTLSRLPQALS